MLLTLLMTMAAVTVSASVQCEQCPMCSHQWSLSCALGYAEPRAADRSAVKRCLQSMLEDGLVGQPEAMRAINRLLQMKLDNPERPTILHFAGDNGVGKTHSAFLISRSMSLRLASDNLGGWNRRGDLLLSIPTAFVGMPLEEARRAIVGQIVQHLTTYPAGIILIDDIQNLREEHFQLLSPLLGRGAPYFPEAPKVQLNRATVILTSDFGKAGRTHGLSDEDLKLLAEDALREAFDHIDLRAVSTIPFKPFTSTYAKALIRRHVESTPCRLSSVAVASITPEAVSWLFRDMQERDQITFENGRAISQRLSEVEVEGKLSVYFASESIPVDSRLAVHLDVQDGNGRGRLVLRVTSNDRLAPSVDL
jgi:ATP-dependent Clp protease ATP-binding subunit ClpA